jgi:hypothetical protein
VTADLVTGAAFAALFADFGRSARRLESRAWYRDSEESDALARFLAGLPEGPEYVAGRDHWLNGTIRAGVCAGKSFTRVRVFTDPLTPYLRFGLHHCRYNIAAGEDIRYLDQGRAIELGLPAHDYWLFDETRLALLWFTADDRLLGAQIVTEPAVVRLHAAWLDLAFAHSTTYREFLAADRSRDRPPPGGF